MFFMRSDAQWMRLALNLAEKGINGVSPNPLVGCVIVKNKKCIGQGYHARFGGPHAEINALKEAGKRARGATIYVTLEPCCHWGKTPPCTEAILKSGIKKVIYAVTDPNPLVHRKAKKILLDSGIFVKEGILKKEATDLNRSFFKTTLNKKPYVILKTALSLDGKIATRTNDSKWISNKESRNFSHHLRTEVDGVLVGGETVRLDNPSLTSHGKGRNPIRIVVTASGNLPSTAKIFNGEAPTWVFSGKQSRRKQPENVQWNQSPSKNGKIDFKTFLKELAGRGISKLLIEGGGHTAAWALEAKEVDEIFFFIAPLLIGGAKAITPFEGTGFGKVKESLQLEHVTVERVAQDILVKGRVKH